MAVLDERSTSFLRALNHGVSEALQYNTRPMGYLLSQKALLLPLYGRHFTFQWG